VRVWGECKKWKIKKSYSQNVINATPRSRGISKKVSFGGAL
jgi:hypothetical protein